jgi:hypothetical protein
MNDLDWIGLRRNRRMDKEVNIYIYIYIYIYRERERERKREREREVPSETFNGRGSSERD